MNAPSRYTWVGDDETLLRATRRLAKARALAVDTEADSFYHYFHKCCLIQISDGEEVYLIDPLALERMQPLGEVLREKSIVKILHAAEQDVMYLRRDYGFHLAPLFDTMIAAQLLGRPSVGLAGLLHSHFDAKLDKGPQRDDWSRRPLTERQKNYAAEDVRQLIRLRDALETELLARGRLGWAQEEFDLVVKRTWESRAFDPQGFWGLKKARELTPREAAILRELFVMRDEKARRADLPPFRIASDESLLALAKRQPATLTDLSGIKGLTPLVRRRIGDSILGAVRAGLEVPEVELPSPPRGQGRRKSAAAQARLERLREWRKTKAVELGLDPGVLFPQSTLEALANAGIAGLDASDRSPGLREWRRRLILPEAAKLLA